jgi:hypothetical protein
LSPFQQTRAERGLADVHHTFTRAPMGTVNFSV